MQSNEEKKYSIIEYNIGGLAKLQRKIIWIVLVSDYYKMSKPCSLATRKIEFLGGSPAG